ncbi:unnamed protein product, partial [Amoebophrya sp. A25]
EQSTTAGSPTPAAYRHRGYAVGDHIPTQTFVSRENDYVRHLQEQEDLARRQEEDDYALAASLEAEERRLYAASNTTAASSGRKSTDSSSSGSASSSSRNRKIQVGTSKSASSSRPLPPSGGGYEDAELTYAERAALGHYMQKDAREQAAARRLGLEHSSNNYAARAGGDRFHRPVPPSQSDLHFPAMPVGSPKSSKDGTPGTGGHARGPRYEHTRALFQAPPRGPLGGNVVGVGASGSSMGNRGTPAGRSRTTNDQRACPTVSTRPVVLHKEAEKYEAFCLDILASGSWGLYIRERLAHWIARLVDPIISAGETTPSSHNKPRSNSRDQQMSTPATSPVLPPPAISSKSVVSVTTSAPGLNNNKSGAFDKASAAFDNASSLVQFQYNAAGETWWKCVVKWTSKDPRVQPGSNLMFGSEAHAIGYGPTKRDAQDVARAYILEELGLCRDFADLRLSALDVASTAGSSTAFGDRLERSLHLLPAIFWDRILLPAFALACRSGKWSHVIDALWNVATVAMDLYRPAKPFESPTEATRFIVEKMRDPEEARRLPSKFLTVEQYRDMLEVVAYSVSGESVVADLVDGPLRNLLKDPRSCVTMAIGGAEYFSRLHEIALLEKSASLAESKAAIPVQDEAKVLHGDGRNAVGRIAVQLDLFTLLSEPHQTGGGEQGQAGAIFSSKKKREPRALGTLVHLTPASGESGNASRRRREEFQNMRLLAREEDVDENENNTRSTSSGKRCRSARTSVDDGFFEIVGPSDLDDTMAALQLSLRGNVGRGGQKFSLSTASLRQVELEYRPAGICAFLQQQEEGFLNFHPGDCVEVRPVWDLVEVSERRQSEALSQLCLSVEGFNPVLRRQIIYEDPRTLDTVARPNIYRLSPGTGTSSGFASTGTVLDSHYPTRKEFRPADVERATNGVSADTQLSKTQTDAIVRSQNAPTGAITFVRGPPGTGKTFAAAEIVYNWYQSDGGHGTSVQRTTLAKSAKTSGILAVAQSNGAANILMNYLWARDLPSLRHGSSEAKKATKERISGWRVFHKKRDDMAGLRFLKRFEEWASLEEELSSALRTGDVDKAERLEAKAAKIEERQNREEMEREQKRGESNSTSSSSRRRDENLQGSASSTKGQHLHQSASQKPFRTDMQTVTRRVRENHRKWMTHVLHNHPRLPVIATNDGAGSEALVKLSR